MWYVLGKLKQNLIWSIPAFMLVGLVFGYFVEATFLKTWIIPLTFMMVYPIMVTLNLKELLVKGNVKLQMTALAINFIVMPALGLMIGKLFFSDRPMVAVGLLLTALLPTSGMTISWTGFAKGNVNAAIKMTIIGLIVGSLLTPLYLKLFMGTIVDISLLNVFKQIAVVVFLPLIMGFLTQLFIKKRFGEVSYNKKYKPKFPMLSVVGVLGIVFVSMALKAKAIISNPLILLYFLIPIIIIYAINFLFSTVIGKLFFEPKDAIALVYGTAMRNLSIALAIAMSAFGDKGSEIALIIAIAYIVQVQASAWYVRFTGRIFEPATSRGIAFDAV